MNPIHNPQSTIHNPQSGKIRVLLADDHTIIREGLRSLLENSEIIDVIGEAEDGREAIRRVEQLHPDVIVMDITMPDLNGLEATRQIKHRFPEVKVLILTVHTVEEYIAQILRAGASGYVVKRAAIRELVAAIQAVHQGNTFLSPVISKTVIDGYLKQSQTAGEADSYASLTEREREVLQLIAEGRSSREIAERLVVAENTVRTHRANLMSKLGLHNTAELTQYAIRKRIINPAE
jgi:two-component system response regulator NreC